MATQAERRQATRNRILTEARTLFVQHGYEATTTTLIQKAAGVSRGALYHHFASKEAIFTTIYEQTSADAINAAAHSAPADESPLESLITGCLNWIDKACEPETASILFEEGPIALGWARCRDIENAYSLRVLRLSIQKVVAAGELHTDSVELTTRLLNALLGEAALALVYPTAKPIDRDDVASTIRNTISALARDQGLG